MRPDPPPRGHELLDDPGADPDQVARSLGNIARANRWMGGAAAVRFGLASLLAGTPGGTRLTLLDLGTGLGDLPRMARRWAARRGIELNVLACDRHPTAAGLAHRGGVPCAVACVSALPFGPRCADLVLVSQLAHHLARGRAVQLLQDANALARVGVIVTDLVRSPVAAAGFGLAARLLRFDHATVHDGVLSVQRGYRVADFHALLLAAGIGATVHRRPGYRLVATWRAQGG